MKRILIASLTVFVLAGVGWTLFKSKPQIGTSVASPKLLASNGYEVSGRQMARNSADAPLVREMTWTRSGDATGWREDQTYYDKTGVPYKTLTQICKDGKGWQYIVINGKSKRAMEMGRCDALPIGGLRHAPGEPVLGRATRLSYKEFQPAKAALIKDTTLTDAETGALLLMLTNQGEYEVRYEATSFRYQAFDPSVLNLQIDDGWQVTSFSQK